MGSYSNPILPGTYPDPSVCRVGDDFYLVTSTFDYWPGLPILHSTDLVNWRQIGHAIDREDQLDLSALPFNAGLYAPTIRHHDGLFHVICTLVAGSDGHGQNFVVTAADAAGPWSDPILLEGAGFDPSFLFDDGRLWMCAVRLAAEPLWPWQTEVWVRELDPAGFAPVGPEHIVWHGALEGAQWAEGPHIYRVDDRYLLIAAEGGTGRQHAVIAAFADSPTGPFRGIPENPVLTHRHLGGGEPLVNVGHADLVDASDGGWWAVLLATRTEGGRETLLGRETHLVPVVWQDSRPVFAPGAGRVLPVVSGDGIPDADPTPAADIDDFDDPTLGLAWNLVRTHDAPRFSLTARPGWLRLPLLAATLEDAASPAFVARRLQHTRASLRGLIEFQPARAGDEAGIALRHTDDAHLTLVIAAGERDDRDPEGVPSRRVVARMRDEGVTRELASHPLPSSGPVELELRVDGLAATASWSVDGRWTALAEADLSGMRAEVRGSFVGTWWGAYATGSGAPSDAVADVDRLEYRASEAVAETDAVG